MKDNRSTSIYEIADMTGVSASTVSRVINHDSRVAKATAIKVQEAMKKAHYVPVPVNKRRGRKPVNGSTMRIVLYSEIWMKPEVIEGISSSLSSDNVELLINDNSSGRIDPTVMLKQRISGIIFWGTPEKLIESGVLNKIPSVNIFGHSNLAKYKCDIVNYNNVSVGKLAAEYLLNSKVDHIVAAGPSDNRIATERFDSFSNTVSGEGRECCKFIEPEKEIYSGIPSERLKEMLKEFKGKTGFFTFNDNLAVHLHVQLLQCGMVPAEDYILISCDNNKEFLSAISPRPQSIDIHFKDIGKQAAKMILWRMQNPTSPVCSVIIEPEIKMAVMQ